MENGWYILFGVYHFVFWNTEFFYFKTKDAGFVFDVTEWLTDYNKYPNFNYFHPPFDNNLRPVYHFILHTVYQYFDVSTKAWYVLSLGLYLMTSVCFLVVLDRLYTLFNIRDSRKLAFLSALTFEVSPFGTELAVWYATIHYSIVFICTFSILLLILHYRNRIQMVAIPAIIFFVIAIFCIELSYSIIPISWALFVLLKRFQKTTTTYRKFIGLIVIPQLIIFFGYNIVTYLFYNKFLGHYSIDKVEFGYDYLGIHFLKIWIKHATIINFFGLDFYQTIYSAIDKAGYILLVVLGTIIGYYGYQKARQIEYKITPFYGLVLFHVLCSGFMYVPVSFLFFHNWKEVELDRLGMGVMIFGMSALVLLWSQIRYGVLRHLIAFAFFGMSCLLLHDYTTRWKKSAIVRMNFIANLPIYPHNNVYVLATPILMKYVYLFAINDSMEIHRQLRVFRKIIPTSSYRIMAFYNMSDIDDIVIAKKINDSTVRCELKKWGNWGWFNLKESLQMVENDRYKLTPDKDNLGYTIQFKKQDTNNRLLLFNRLNFIEVDLTKHEVGHVFID